MRIEPENLLCAVGIERQIHARAYAELQHTALGQPDGTLPIRRKLAVPHRKIHKMGNDVFRVKSHHLSPKASFESRGYQFLPFIDHAVPHSVARVATICYRNACCRSAIRSSAFSSPIDARRRFCGVLVEGPSIEARCSMRL